MLRLWLIWLLTLLTAPYAASQELNCRVEINADKVSGFESVFSTLQDAVTEYLNTTKFTSAQFSPNEKINCQLFLTVDEYSDDVISGNLQIQSTRPVYNSSYTTTVLNFRDDKISFTYRQNEPLIFNETVVESNLTAILDYYAYLILALDFDTFSPQGGSPYYDRMASIVQIQQSSGEVGWKTFEDNRNRSAVLMAFTDPGTSVMRELLYNYHRRGLDEMAISPDKGRATITQSLEALKKVYEKAPMSVALSLWRDAKLDELINIYSKGSQSERDQVYDLLISLYPTEQNRLKDIKNPPLQR